MPLSSDQDPKRRELKRQGAVLMPLPCDHDLRIAKMATEECRSAGDHSLSCDHDLRTSKLEQFCGADIFGR